MNKVNCEKLRLIQSDLTNEDFRTVTSAVHRMCW